MTNDTKQDGAPEGQSASKAMLGTCGHFCEACARRDDEIKRLRALANAAFEAWDSDRDMKVGKLLHAMIDVDFCAGYRPDLMPNGPDVRHRPEK
jgi:hypothetical protein